MSNEWISVEDRLPEIPQKFYDEEMGCWVKPLSVQVILHEGGDVFEGSYHKDGSFSSWMLNGVAPTHWMPLPQPPK